MTLNKCLMYVFCAVGYKNMCLYKIVQNLLITYVFGIMKGRPTIIF